MHSLKVDDGRPLYRRLSDQLRAEIAALKPGDRIASEPELAQRLNVSRFTVAKAIEGLVDEGLLVRRQGKGTYVAAQPLKRLPGQLRSYTDSVVAAGRRPRSELIAFGPVAWTPETPNPADQALVALDRLRFADGAPVAIHHSVLSQSVSDELGLNASLVGKPDFSLYREMERAGLALDHCVEALTARLPKPEERDLLRLGASDVVMVIQRQTYGADGRLLDHVAAIHDCRHYSYQALLMRHPQRGIPPALAMKESGDGKVVPEEVLPGAQRFGPRFGPQLRGARRSGG
jgi:GntR family transcriptional regulator